MTWRLLTCFSLMAATLSGASVSGLVQLRDSRAAAVVKRRDFSGIVVSLRPLNAPSMAASPAHVQMTQRNKTFSPHILSVMAGSVVDFPNFDPIFHSAFSSYNGQIFDVGLYPPGTSRSVKFSKPGVVRVFCNIHPTMSAVVLVLNTQYFTTTLKDGSWALDVPPGTYELNVFHERATDQALRALTQKVTVTGEGQKLPPIGVSEAGYLTPPHKDKYGKDYGPPSDDKIIYPGVRN